MKASPSFKVNKRDRSRIESIAKRASIMASGIGIEYTVLNAEMDIAACHANGCPLDLTKLLYFDQFNFAHDVFGIRKHINRTDGKLKDCFLPRSAK